MRIALVSSELAPFAKTGGLGDVAAALPRFLQRAGHDARAFLPLYGTVETAGRRFERVEFARDIPVRAGRRTFTCSLYASPLPSGGRGGGGPAVYFVDCPALYAGRGIYAADGDEHLRFSVLSRAALDGCQRMGFAPDIVHAHDWHAALLPLFLKTLYSWDGLFRSTSTVLTIHNLAYQGVFPSSVLEDLALDGATHLLDRGDLAAGRVGFLKTGILHAGAVTAVSRTFAKEIQDPEHGFGLDAYLRARSGSVFGIPNGIDADEWNPATDPHLPARYDAGDLGGKAVCRAALLQELGLAPGPTAPVFGIVSRLAGQKGFDLLLEILPKLLSNVDCRLAVLGGGESRYVEFFRGLERRFPGKAAYRDGQREPLAHRIEAGSDVFLMPSLFEPCGLNQMFSQRYGTLPVVRRTGGLADTVEPWNPSTGEGTGFMFEHYTADGLEWAILQCLKAWSDAPAWRRLQARAMARDFSWDRRIGEYVDLYERLRRGR